MELDNNNNIKLPIVPHIGSLLSVIRACTYLEFLESNPFEYISNTCYFR